ncbi:MAG TPA: fibronectin type III domain-containing protein, partial [Rhodospirillales bacterium]
MSEADFIKTMLSVQGDEALARLRDFESRLKSDPNDVTALYGSHILTWRQGSVDAAVHLLHQLLSNLPCHPASIQHFSGHLRNNQEYETLANAYLREFPAERSGYLMALIIQRNVRRFDQMKKTLRQCAENTGLGVHFQPFVIASLFDAAQGVPYTSLGDLTLVAETRADYSAQRYDKAGGGPPPVQAWAPLEIGESRAVLAASVADTGGDIAVTFRIGRADEPDGPSIEVPGEAVDADPTPGVGIRHFRATVDGLTPGAEYRYAVGIDGKAPVAVAEINTFRTLGHEPPEVVTGEAEPTGRGSVNLNGAVAGTTLPTRYHFRYGKSPKSLRRQTPTRWLPAGLCGRVRDAGENVYRRLTVYGLTVCFVRPGAPATDGGPHPRCNAAMTIEWPFGKDRNHLNGIGVIDLLSGWRSAAHLRGRVPRAFDSKVFPKPAYPGETLDLSDARFAVTYRARDFNAKAFHPVAWVHAGTGKAVESTISENLAPWAYTGQLESRAFISDGQWHRLSFELDCDSNAWSFCGTNTEEMGSTMERYTYHPIGAALRENRNGNICICFVFGDELDTPEGDIEFGELELVYRSQSLLLPGQGTALIAWPADAAFDPGLLTGGWIGDLDHCWQELGNRPGPKEFVWRFRDTASIKTVCLHQHPVWPAKE